MFIIISEFNDIAAQSVDIGKNIDGSDLSLSFTWPSPRSLLEKPPLSAGSSSIIQKNHSLSTVSSIGSGIAQLNAIIVPGDSKLPCFQMYEELETLKGFASGLYGQGIYMLSSCIH